MTVFAALVLFLSAVFNVVTWPAFLRRVAKDPRATDAAGLSLEGACVASDAFFPFRDGLDVLAEAGAKAVIQPGGGGG